MGFIKEIYSDNRAGLVVAFGRGETSENYYNGDSIEEAMKHFNMYLKNNLIYIKTEDEKALNNLGINAQDAAEFRSTVNIILNTLSDEEAIQAPILFPVWQEGIEYKVGDRIRFDGKLYKVIQDHTSQGTWIPLSAPSLFSPLLIDEESGEILEWTQPESTNGYSIGDKVIYNGVTYVSTADNNIFEPGTINAPWETVEENIETTDEIKEWTSDASYQIGDHINYNNAEYESLIDNNIWSPEEYPAGWNRITE